MAEQQILNEKGATEVSDQVPDLFPVILNIENMRDNCFFAWFV